MNKLLSSLRILDENGQLSLTNMAVIASVAKLALCAIPTVPVWLVMATSIASYQFKRFHASKQTNTDLFEARIKDVENGISAIKSGMALRR